MEDGLNTIFNQNKKHWDNRVAVHLDSAFYNVAAWKLGKSSLNAIELREMGDVTGKTILHLQCHFGQDTMSWSRMGAKTTGCDFSENAIAVARQLNDELGLDAEFVCCNLYDLPQHLSGKFDFVFTSYGTIGWLPDLDRWAAVVAHFLKPGGRFYMVDFHPVIWMFDEKFEVLKYPYLGGKVIETTQTGTYADFDADLNDAEFGWNHGLSAILNNLIAHGLTISHFQEYDYSPYTCFENMTPIEHGFQIKGLEGIIPMLYSITAVKPH